MSGAGSSSHYRADIQGLRGVAVLLVVLFHAGDGAPGGYIGVDVFFVISGFVITQLLWRELTSTNTLSISTFYTRRVRRILPALAVLVVGVSLLSALLENPLGSQRHTATAGMSALGFVANQYLYAAKIGAIGATANSNPILHTWSLAVEEQFYLVFPLALLLAALVARKVFSGTPPRRTVAAVVGVGCAGSFALSALMTSGNLSAVIHSPELFAFYSSITRAWEFAAGALVAILAPKFSKVRPNEAIALGAVGLILVIWSVRAYDVTTPFPGTAALAPVLGTVFIIAAGLQATGGVTWLLSTTPIVRLGDVSYGWYLWHWPTMVFATILFAPSRTVLTIAAVVALVPTVLSYHYVEQPIRFNRALHGRRAVSLAAVCISVPLVAALALGASARAISHTSLRGITAAVAPHADETRHCENNAPVETRPSACTWRATNPRGDIWLVGDSEAGQFTEPAAAAANHDGYNLHVATSAGCSFADLVLIDHLSALSSCSRFVRATVATLIREKPQLVVLANDTTTYLADGRFEFRDDTTRSLAVGPVAKTKLWPTALARVLHRFANAGIPVVVLDTIPHFGGWTPARCPAVKIYFDVASCGTSSSLPSIRFQQLPGLFATSAAMSGLTNVTDTDFTSDLCPAATCATNDGPRFLYSDSGHLTIATARSLTPRFVTLFRQKAATTPGR